MRKLIQGLRDLTKYSKIELDLEGYIQILYDLGGRL